MSAGSEQTPPWPPPSVGDAAASAAGRAPAALTVSLVAGGIGWAVLLFVVAAAVFAGEETNCIAHRGERYGQCVRSSDLTGIRALAIAVGLAVLCLVLAVRVRHTHRRSGRAAASIVGPTIVGGTLLLATLVGWLIGTLQGWAPERPLPYQPVPEWEVNLTVLVGAAVGLLVGVLMPLGRRSRR